MKLKLPTASRKRLEELLTYLGKTENYSEYYKGNRAEDFKKCFDIESPWCWKYADIVLRGLGKRTVGPGDEVHHAVPRSFYGVKNRCHKIDDGNIFTLSYAEHVWAHYCLVCCATGKMHVKMVRAFLTMYSIGMAGSKTLMPSEAELLDAIPEMEYRRIRAMEPKWSKVETEGRTHYSEDPKQYNKEYREANKEKLTEYKKAHYEANKDKYAEINKANYEANKDKYAEINKAYREANKDKLSEYNKVYRETNRERIAEHDKAYHEANKEKIAAQRKTYYEANRENLVEKQKAHYEANREKILAQKKASYDANKEKFLERCKAHYEANKEKILEQHKAHYEANKEKILERCKAYHEANKEKIAAQRKTYYEANKEKIAAYLETNKEKIAAQRKAHYDAMKAAGYRYRKDPVTGKHGWVFVGKPATPETPKSSTTAD